MKLSAYHKMSVAEKEKVARGRIREPAIRCTECGSGCQPEDMLAHKARCKGRPEIHPLSRWVSFSETTNMGLLKDRLARLSRAGRIRTKGPKGHRRYLLSDVVRFAPAVDPTRKNASNLKPLTNTKARHPRSRVRNIKPLSDETISKIEALVRMCGSMAKASRVCDVSVDTLSKAAKGVGIRRSTRMLIEAQIDQLGEV